MNFLQERVKRNQYELTIENFRKHQYENIHYFSDVIVNFLSKLNKNYLTKNSSSFAEIINYKGINNSQFSEYSITVNKDQTVSELFKIYLPKLVDEYFFYLNGNFYIPAIYTIDYPIICKNESIKLTALFNSITLYMKDDIVVFINHNIPLSMFLQLFLQDKEGKELYQEFIIKKKLKHEKHSDENLINYFKQKFSGNTYSEIKTQIENLFLDDYTKSLYEKCYDFEINIENIIKYALRVFNNDEVPNFIDLKNKRMVFLEILLRPLLDRISSLSINISKGQKVYSTELDKYSVIKYFLRSPNNSAQKKINGLGGNYIYDIQNLYSGILQHKISFIPPGIERPPKEIKNIHPTHYGIICPVTVSSQKPGSLVSVNPETKLDSFGRFLDVIENKE
ncbi:MAG: hypothetical protein ACOC22_02585 [bacterium]